MKVNDYVRTKYGTISKIESKRDYTHGDYEGGENDFYLNVNHTYQDFEEIIKSSPNIIDLIEIGDYVNGYKIVKKNKYTLYIEDYADEDSYLYISQENIKSIVTKEQFEAMEYKVGE